MFAFEEVCPSGKVVHNTMWKQWDCKFKVDVWALNWLCETYNHFVNYSSRHFDVDELTDCCSHFVTTRNHLSFSFSFFIHGESSVCTAVEIQRQQRIRHLTLEDVAVAATRQEGLPGIASGLVCTCTRLLGFILDRLTENYCFSLILC